MRPLIDAVWLDIEGYEGLYQVSDQGQVRSCERVETFVSKRKGGEVLMTRKRCSCILVPSTQDYETVRLYNNGIMTAALVHRLVAHAFVENPDNKPEVNHIDEDKLNNWDYNLEYVTRSENALHSVAKFRGENSGTAKLTNEDVKEIVLMLEDHRSQTIIAECFGVTIHTIHKIKMGKNWGWLTGLNQGGKLG